MQPFDKAVEHLKGISSAFSLDLDVLRDGFVDLQTRLHALEQMSHELNRRTVNITNNGGPRS